MPRKAKEKIEENKIFDEKELAIKKTTTSRKKASKTSSDTNTSTGKKASKTYTNSETTTKKKVSKASIENKSTTQKRIVKTSSNKKTATRKRVTKKVAESNENPVAMVEYYDLPYKYGHTLIRLLAQTPKTLFVYWEVSDADIVNFKKSYGDDFFNKTKPVLIVHNLTLNKSYEVEINDFANCWYLNTEDSDCRFDIELGRRLIHKPNYLNTYNEMYEQTSSDSPYSEKIPNYIYITTSNNLQSPNDHILFEKLNEFVVFRNVNNDTIIKKNIKSFKFLKNIYKFYKDMYNEEILNNPSSKFTF